MADLSIQPDSGHVKGMRSGPPAVSLLFTSRETGWPDVAPEAWAPLIDGIRQCDIARVWLELFPGDIAGNDPAVGTISLLRSAGLEVGGCLTLSPLGKPGSVDPAMACYTSTQTQADLEHAIRQTAMRVDNLMISRLETDCECEECRRAKRRRPWGEYRRGLMLGIAKERILLPAREANPRVSVTLMLPPDYETAVRYGYNAVALAQIFDRVILGDTGLEGTGRPSYFYYRWLSDIAGRKLSGAVLRSSDPARGLDAAVEMTLAGAPELILRTKTRFSGAARPPSLEALASRLDLRALGRAAWKTPLRGIAAYRPMHGTGRGEPYLFDALRLLGLPLRPTPRFPSSSRSAFFSLDALADAHLGEKLDAYLENGGVAWVTSGLIDALKESGTPRAVTDRLGVSPFPPPGARARGAGLADRLEVTDVDRPALDAMRRALLAPLGVTYSGPPGVTLSLFGHRDVVLQNSGDSPAVLTLEVAGKRLAVAATSGTEHDAGSQPARELILAPHAWIYLTT